MMRRHGVGLYAAGAVLALGALWLWFQTRSSPVGETNKESPDIRETETRDSPASSTLALLDAAASLNAHGGGIRDDLRILNVVFDQWATNFPRTGNPAGNNAEITAALTGANPLQLDLIPAGHPAINANGELCDRWGTPFRFHQWSGTVMEIISAGPDRDFATGDDVSTLEGRPSAQDAP